jgi:transposase
MNLHANAKLGLAGRVALVRAIEGGLSLNEAAALFSVSPATAHRWWHRWLDGDRSLGSLADRSSRPHRSPRQLSAGEEEPILQARRQTGYGPGRLAGIVRRARSTIWKVLRRHGLSPRPRVPAPPPRRYEWSRPGALLHIDVKRLVRFQRPGHRVTGDSTAHATSVSITCTVSSTTAPVTPMSSCTHATTPTPPPGCSSGRSHISPSSASIRPRR